MNRLRAAEFCWERGGAQVGKRADGSSRGDGLGAEGDEVGGGEGVDGFGGGEGLLAGRFVVSGGCQEQ